MGKYAMHKAAKIGDFETLKLLIELGWSVDSLDKEGQSPLHVAAQSGQRSVAELLIRNHCNIGIIDIFGMTPLLWAAKYGDIEVVKLLLERGALANGVDCRRRTDLSILGCPEVVQLIGGADVNAFDHDGWTPLMFAALGGHEEVVAYLIRGGAQVNLRDSCNRTALQVASRNGHAEVVKLLLKEEGIDLDTKDFLGDTPLHKACFYGHVEIAKHLLKAGASMKGKNKEGQSALCLSISKENVEIVRLLVQHGAHFEDEEHSRMFQNTSLSFKERVLKDVELCTQSLLNKFHNQSLPALKRITRLAERIPRKVERLELKDNQIHEIKNYVKKDIQANNFRNLERKCSAVLSVLCVQCLINNQ